MADADRDPTDTPARGVVLVADDSATVREVVRLALEDAGYRVVPAADGTEALALAREQLFDVIVSDVRMPGLDGLALLEAVRMRDREVPVVLVTGAPELATAIRAVEYGAFRYLVKPVEPSQIVDVVREAVRLRRLAQINRLAYELVSDRPGLAADRTALGIAFDRALRSLWMAYQPIVSWSRRKVFGFEALLRSGEETLPDAMSLVKAAERLGRVHELGRCARELAAAGAQGLVNGRLLFVNVHPSDLDDGALYDPGSPLSRVAGRVVLEITERAGLDDIRDLEARVKALRRIGYRIAIDDLGAGYASLTSFAELSPDIVKIDMAIVQGSDRSPTRARVIGSLAQLCDEMQVKLIGEGIETVEERDRVAGLGCDLLQGFLFARPGQGFPAVAPEAYAAADGGDGGGARGAGRTDL